LAKHSIRRLPSRSIKKILIVAGAPPGNAQTFVMNQVEALVEAGHDVTYCALQYSRDLPGRLHDAAKRLAGRLKTIQLFPDNETTVQSMPLALRGLATLTHAAVRQGKWSEPFVGFSLNPRLIRLAASAEIHGQYDAILCHFGMPAVLFDRARALGLVSGKLAVFFHGRDIPKPPAASRYRKLTARAELVVANSQFTAKRLAGLGLSSPRLKVIPVGLFPERWPLIGPRGGARFFTIARLTEKKGLEYAIRALRLVRLAGYPATMSIFGDGPLRQHLQALVAELSLEEAVQFCGFVPQEQFVTRLADMDAFVLPSVTAASGDMEGQGLALAEAQAMGFPVIATRHNGFPDSVVEDKTAFLVAERDVEALAACMIRLIDCPDLARDMGKDGRAFAIEKFDQRKIVGEILSALFHEPFVRDQGA